MRITKPAVHLLFHAPRSKCEVLTKQLPKLIFNFILAMAACAACSTVNCKAAEAPSDDPLRVVACIFPEYDWVRQVLGPDSPVRADLLLSQGVDMHSFAPSAQDIISVSDCDLFIYTGGESDAWVNDILKQSANPDLVSLNLMDILREHLLDETVLEGMTAGEEHHEGHSDEEDALHEADEHIWLSLKNACICTQAIADALAGLDPANAQLYQNNAEDSIAALNELDASYQAAVDSAAQKSILIADRYPFRYMAEDYGLTCYAAFSGCTAETEASFETIAYLTGKLDELDLHTVLVTESSDRKLAETIVKGSADPSRQILVLDSLQSTTLQDTLDGATYLSSMEANLDVLKQALA